MDLKNAQEYMEMNGRTQGSGNGIQNNLTLVTCFNLIPVNIEDKSLPSERYLVAYL